jgi:hypothetical protein
MALADRLCSARVLAVLKLAHAGSAPPFGNSVPSNACSPRQEHLEQHALRGIVRESVESVSNRGGTAQSSDCVLTV